MITPTLSCAVYKTIIAIIKHHSFLKGFKNIIC